MEFKLKSLNDSLTVEKIANVHFFEFENKRQTKPDSHPFCELLFSYAGTLNVSAEHFEGTLKRGELIIHQANEKHSLYTQKNKQTTVVILGFQCNCPYLKYFSERKIRLDEGEIKQIARIIKEGRNVFSPPYDKPVYDMKKKETQIFGSEQLLRSLLENFLIELIRKHQFSRSEAESETQNFQFGEILDYIDLHYAERLTLDEISFLFNTNRSTFCREFKAYTGYTFIHYIAKKKTEKIQKILLEENKSLSEIAEALNFESTAYFCRFFKKQTGVTPKEYRRQFRK